MITTAKIKNKTDKFCIPLANLDQSLDNSLTFIEKKKSRHSALSAEI